MFKDEELLPRKLLGVLSFLMHFDIHIANNWQPNIDSEIKQIKSVPGRRQSLFFLCQLRTLFAKLAHCSFRTTGIHRLGWWWWGGGGGGFSDKFPSPLQSCCVENSD